MQPSFLQVLSMFRLKRLQLWSLIRLGLGCLIGSGCHDGRGPDSSQGTGVKETADFSVDQVADIRAFCTHCHAFPDPLSFPREAWKAEVGQGYRLFYDSPTEGLKVPLENTTVAWFEALAPERLEMTAESADVEVDRFQLADRLADDATGAGSVACLRFDPDRQQLWACDMRTGSLFSAHRGGPLTLAARPPEVVNPCRVTPVDLDRDGTREILVSELGSLLPNDRRQGAVWSFSPDDNWAGVPIMTSVGRVSDVQPADFDGDGDVDLVVAEFGWRRTGRIVVLWNEGEGQWREEVLDKRHGAIDVPVVDLNADGRPDIVALISQEYEIVVCYLNQGDGTFDLVSLYEAGDPSFGSSGIQVVDLDGDGDFDVLHTNGDNSDDGYVKPFHGIRWLENTGKTSFDVHELAPMPGVHRAIAGDVDLDGDLDVVAVSLLPPNAAQSISDMASILWLEQTTAGNFVRHVVETGAPDHSSCELVDWDSDGDLDLCVTHFRWSEERGSAISWFRNVTNNPPAN